MIAALLCTKYSHVDFQQAPVTQQETQVTSKIIDFGE